MHVASRLVVSVLICVLGVAVRANAQPHISLNGVAGPDPVTSAAGAIVSVTVTAGPGNPMDWVALSAVGAPDSAYVSWRYLNGTTSPPATGLTDATVSLQAPVAAGAYEVRFFANNGYTRLATSGELTVSAPTAVIAVNGVPPPGAVSVTSGSSISVAVNDGPANPRDWVAFYPFGAADSAHVDWRYLNNTTVAPSIGAPNGTVTFIAPVAVGDYDVRFFANDSYARLATSTTISVTASPASLSINGQGPPDALSVGAGTHVTVDVANGPSNAGDWVGLYAANAADTAFVTWRYLNGTTTLPSTGTASATLDFAVPTSGGSYEFRFFAANGYVRLATSTTMIVASSTSELSVNGVSPPDSVTVAAGSVGVVSVSGGPANPGDWVGLYAIGAPDSPSLDSRYLNDTAVAPSTGVSTATLHFTMPAQPGTYEFRFFCGSRVRTPGHERRRCRASVAGADFDQRSRSAAIRDHAAGSDHLCAGHQWPRQSNGLGRARPFDVSGWLVRRLPVSQWLDRRAFRGRVWRHAVVHDAAEPRCL